MQGRQPTCRSPAPSSGAPLLLMAGSVVLLLVLLHADFFAVSLGFVLSLGAAERPGCFFGHRDAAKARQGRRGRWSRMAGLPFFTRFFGSGFREAPVDACVVDRESAFGVTGQQQVGRPEEDVVAALADREEIVGTGALTTGDQIGAATFGPAAAGSFALPLVDVEVAVGIPWRQGFGGLEEGALAVGTL